MPGEHLSGETRQPSDANQYTWGLMYCVCMQSPLSALDLFLDDAARAARPGDRLPPIRDLMRRFGASQVSVQRALDRLKSRGLIASRVGRGTTFLGSNADSPIRAPIGAAASKSILLLRRSISIARGRLVMEGLQRQFAEEGHRVLEVSYTDPDHARTMLRGLPRFDACVIQSSFKVITIELLAALREKCAVLAVDGATLSGTDVEAVGMEWGEPLELAVTRLAELGHQRIAFASTSQPFLANQLGLRRFEHLQRTLPNVALHSISMPFLPNENYETELVGRVQAALDATGRLPYSALVAWGIEDGARFRRLLAEVGVQVPQALSVVLLGRTDLASEHADFFATVGCRVSDQIEQLHAAILSRWQEPDAAYGVRLIPVSARDGQSIGAPVTAPTLRPGRPRAPRSRP